MASTTHGKNIKIFAGNSHKKLAKEIASRLQLPLGNAEVKTFSDGEICVNINETVRGSEVFIIQSTNSPINDNLMELLIMIDALKRASAAKITAVIPYYGYARQDRKAKARDPISAKLVADLITVAGADRVLTIDLHVPQIQGFFNIPVDHLLGVPLLAGYFKGKFKDLLDQVCVVSPDHGSVGRARQFAQKLNVPFAIVDKRRPKPNVSEVMSVIGEIKDKYCIMVDDMIDTAGTITIGAQALIERGAKEVYAACTHGVLSGPAIERLQNSVIKELVLLDTIDLPKEKQIPIIKQLSVAPICAEAIKRIYEDVAISPLYE
ncbi:MAG: ribose-phosphate diphosphokinase [Bacillota bacterium]|nr:ribose-phosphate diphosphokinase [Bacillota bacterium]